MYNFNHEFHYKRSAAGLLLMLITSMIIAYPLTLKAIEIFPQMSFITLFAVLFSGLVIYYLLLLRKAYYGHNKVIIQEQQILLPGSGVSIKSLTIPYPDIHMAEDLYSGIGLRRKLKIFLNNNRSLSLDSNYFNTERDYEDFLYYLSSHIKIKTRDKLSPPLVEVLGNILFRSQQGKQKTLEDIKQDILNAPISKRDRKWLFKKISSIFRLYKLAKSENEFTDRFKKKLAQEQQGAKFVVRFIEIIILIMLLAVLIVVLISRH